MRVALPQTSEHVPPALLDWRALVRQAALEGLLREVAAESEVVEFKETGVLLRPASLLIATGLVAQQMSEAITRAVGHPFAVRFDAHECAKGAANFAQLEHQERESAQRALVEAFRSDPFVQECLNTLHATLDESSVRPLTELEKKEMQS